MFGHNRTDYPYDCTSEFPVPEAQSFPPPPLFIPIPGGGGDRDCLSALRSEMQGGGYTSSGCSSYGGSPTSYSPTIIHRSISTHSLHQNPDLYSSPPPPYYDCGTHSSSSSVRKVLSTGDLQVTAMHQLCYSTRSVPFKTVLFYTRISSRKVPN